MDNNAKRILLVLITTGFLTACNTLSRQPKLTEAQISPSVLHPGESATITVKPQDKRNIIQEIVAVVREDPRQKFRLRDDGQAPHDSVAKDGIWSFMVDVPLLAPPGQFTLEITAFDSKGRPVMVKTRDGVKPLQQVCPFVIEYKSGNQNPNTQSQ